MSQKIDIRERRYNGADYDTLHPETNINMVLDSGGNSIGGVNGALYGDGNGNIVGATISNPNLLDNPWFRVNQRGATSGTTINYIADRWSASYGSGGVTWSRTDDTITLQSTTGLDFAYLEQKMEEKLYNSLGGKTVTLSVMLGDYSILSGTTTNFRLDSSFAIQLGVDAQGNRIFCTFYNDTHLLSIAKKKTPLTLRAVKLELGSVSTLANDVAPNYYLELAKCQVYFARIKMSTNYSVIGLGICVTNGTTVVYIPKPYNMRPITSINYSGSFKAYALNLSADYAVSNVTLGSSTTNNITVIFSTEGTIAGTTYFLQSNNDPNAYIDLIADL